VPPPVALIVVPVLDWMKVRPALLNVSVPAPMSTIDAAPPLAFSVLIVLVPESVSGAVDVVVHSSEGGACQRAAERHWPAARDRQRAAGRVDVAADRQRVRAVVRPNL